MNALTQLGTYFGERERVLLDPTYIPSVRDTLPLPIYMSSRLRIVTDRRKNVRRLHAVSRAFADRGVSDLRHSIEALATPSPERAVATVHFHHEGRDGPHGQSSQIVYYLQHQRGDIRVAMLEILHCPAYALAEEWQFRLQA